MAGVTTSINEEDLTKILLRQKNYLRDFSGEDEITESNAFFKRYLKDILKGACGLFCYLEPDKYVMITQDQIFCTLIVDLYVEPEFRRTGIATNLVNLIEGPIKLECYDDNPATKLYKKLGFEKQEDWYSAPGCSWWLKIPKDYPTLRE